MALLEDVSIQELHAALDAVETKKPVTRLLLAILYKHGPSVPMIAAWFDMREDTIYRWFREMEREPVLEAIHDESPPGRPPKLTGIERARFEAALQNDPAEVGYDASAWTPALAHYFLQDEFDVEYTHRHVRRLLNATGRSHPTRPTNDESD